MFLQIFHSQRAFRKFISLSANRVSFLLASSFRTLNHEGMLLLLLSRHIFSSFIHSLMLHH